jgi:hypothetical protein
MEITRFPAGRTPNSETLQENGLIAEIGNSEALSADSVAQRNIPPILGGQRSAQDQPENHKSQ